MGSNCLGAILLILVRMTTTAQIAIVIVIINSYLYFRMGDGIGYSLRTTIPQSLWCWTRKINMASNRHFEDDVADERVEAWVREGAGGVKCVAFEPGWMFVSTADHQCLTLVVWRWLERERV